MIVNVVFRPGAEYIYRYETEALTGIKTVSDQLSGVKVRSTVKIQIHRDGTTLLKVCSPTCRSNAGVHYWINIPSSPGASLGLHKTRGSRPWTEELWVESSAVNACRGAERSGWGIVLHTFGWIRRDCVLYRENVSIFAVKNASFGASSVIFFFRWFTWIEWHCLNWMELLRHTVTVVFWWRFRLIWNSNHHESANQTRGQRLDTRGSCATFTGLTTPLFLATNNFIWGRFRFNLAIYKR